MKKHCKLCDFEFKITNGANQRKYCSSSCRQKRWERANKKSRATTFLAWRKKNPGYLGPKRQALVDRVNLIKSEAKCKDCGGGFPACCMDFDHAPGTKHRDVGTLIARSHEWEIIEKEIGKCDIVCANCHRIRTKKRGSNGWTRKTLDNDDTPKSQQP